MECYYCDEILTSVNESIEHIIPNAIGGRLKSKDLLCKKCNSLLGEKYDSQLCNSLSILAGFLDIRREKGENPTIKNAISESGERFNLIKGRNPQMVAPVVNMDKENNSIHISARDEKELKTILKGLKRKYPNLDDNDLENKFVRQKYYMNEVLTLKMEVGNKDFLKAIIKIAINFFIFNEGDKETVKQRVEDLKNDREVGVEVVRHYYMEESIAYNNPDEVSHSIYINGSKKGKYLFAFVELFSSYAFVVTLNSNYTGDDVSYSYTYDVLACTPVEKNIDINYKGALPEDIPNLNTEFIDTLTQKLNRVIRIADKRQVNAVISAITDIAWRETLGKYPLGTVITQDMLNVFVNKVAQEAAPFIAHLHNKGSKRKPMS